MIFSGNPDVEKTPIQIIIANNFATASRSEELLNDPKITHDMGIVLSDLIRQQESRDQLLMRLTDRTLKL